MINKFPNLNNYIKFIIPNIKLIWNLFNLENEKNIFYDSGSLSSQDTFVLRAEKSVLRT